MASSPVQPSVMSLSLAVDQPRTSAESQEESAVDSISQSDLVASNSLVDKWKSGMRWIVDPVSPRRSLSATDPPSPKHHFDAQCLKPQLNRVTGPLKYFAFGVMFTNGILGFVLFLIGLWSAFEHRKITHMPSVNRTKTSSLTPFNFMGIILCIFGLLFFLLCIISCLGINRENLNLLRISLLGQFLTLIVFLISATMILVWGERIRHKIGETMMAGLRTHYHVDEAWTAFYDKLHMSYFCCGVYSFNDWNDNANYACTPSNILQNPEACSVPFTCCKTSTKEDTRQDNTKPLSYTCGAEVLPLVNATANMDEIQERININGCFDEILPVIQQLIITAAVFMLLICVIIFVTVFLTCSLTFEIRLTISNVKQYCAKKRHEQQEDNIHREEETF